MSTIVFLLLFSSVYYLSPVQPDVALSTNRSLYEFLLNLFAPYHNNINTETSQKQQQQQQQQHVRKEEDVTSSQHVPPLQVKEENSLTDTSAEIRNQAATTTSAVGSSSTDKIATSTVIYDTLLQLPGISAEYVWDQLLVEASHRQQQELERSSSYRADIDSTIISSDTIVIMEVGMHTARQCVQAARYGLQTHCIEPSPKSIERVKLGIQKENRTIQSYIHLYGMAAGTESGLTIPFVSSGSTGDHVGEYDMWNMQPGKPKDTALALKQGDTILVPTIRLDDIIATKLVRNATSVFALKVHTQGYEPSVLQGLSNSLEAHQVQFVLMEYWPRGMDLIATTTTVTTNETESIVVARDTACIASTNVLQQLLRHEYTIYALPPNTHPRAPSQAREYIKRKFQKAIRSRHDNITAFCHWFYTVEDMYPWDEYKMGYWADLLAVAPTVWEQQQKQKQPYSSVMLTAHTELVQRIVQTILAINRAKI
jgi:FkbM family methyltransferase